MGGTGWVDPPTVQSDFRWGARWRAEIPHFDHGIPKLNKEQKLAARESVDYANGVGPGRGEQLLVTLEKPAVALQVVVVIFVELVWCGGVEIHSCYWSGTHLAKLLPVDRVQRRVRQTGAVEVVESSGEEEASGTTERVRS